MENTDKKCGFFKSILRYNTSLIAEIAGPVTGYDNLRAKRISLIKGQCVMWERGTNDVILDKDDAKFVRLVGCGFPSLFAGQGVYYVNYADVLIDGKLNRIQVRTALVRKDAVRSKHPFEGGVPIVSGWIKNPSSPNSRDSHFDDPICPPGYSPLICGYVQAETIRPSTELLKMGIISNYIGGISYLREKPYLFSSIDPIEEKTEIDSESKDLNDTPVVETKEENKVESSNSNTYTQLAEAKKLFDDGLISEEDYKNKKNQILGINKTKNKDSETIAKTAPYIFAGIPIVFILFYIVLNSLDEIVSVNGGSAIYRYYLFETLFNHFLPPYYTIMILSSFLALAALIVYIFVKRKRLLTISLASSFLLISLIMAIVLTKNHFYFNDSGSDIIFTAKPLSVIGFGSSLLCTLIGLVFEVKKKVKAK